VIVPHLRDDYPHKESQTIHNFHFLVESLRAQNFPASDFELVLPDSQWKRRKDYFSEHPQPFAVKHIPKKASLWHQRRFCDISNGYNTGIVHADGELLLLLSSGCEFRPDALRRCWEWREKGLAAAFMYDCVCANAVLRIDCRRTSLFWHDGLEVFPAGCNGKFYAGFYGHQCAPLSDCLEVNGFDELWDGTKGANDTEFGVRLSKAGVRFVHDENLELKEHAHTDLPWGTVLDPNCEDGRWHAFRELKAKWLHLRNMDPLTGYEANRYPMPVQVMEHLRDLTMRLGGEIPPWASTYTDKRLCFDLRTLRRERRERDGLANP